VTQFIQKLDWDLDMHNFCNIVQLMHNMNIKLKKIYNLYNIIGVSLQKCDE